MMSRKKVKVGFSRIDGIPPVSMVLTVVFLLLFRVAVDIFSNIKGLTYYASNAEDPYVTLADDPTGVDPDDRLDLEILPSDSLLLAARTEDDMSHLEVYVYEENE